MSEYKPTPNIQIEVLLENRLLPKAMVEWISEKIDPVTSLSTPGLLAEGDTWCAWVVVRKLKEPSIVNFRFKTRDQAMMFKLVWAGL